MEIKAILDKYSLNTDNSIVLGSGILRELNIRPSLDNDVLVEDKTFDRLSLLPEFKITNPIGLVILKTADLEIGRVCSIGKIGNTKTFKEVLPDTIVINDVRYITLQFLLKIKKEWITFDNPREKDLKDIELIEDYLKRN